MRTRWIFKLCAPLASAAVLLGCTQEVTDDQTQNRTPIDHATNHHKQSLRLTVTGCLGTGTGTNQFVLSHAQLVPLAEQPTDAMSATNFTLPTNSSVRLALNNREVDDLVGQTVKVTGLLTDTGADTIGTAGQPPVPEKQEPRTDQSKAATDQHHADKVKQEAGPIGHDSMNNGTFPEMTVQQITGTGQQCTTSPVEDRR